MPVVNKWPQVENEIYYVYYLHYTCKQQRRQQQQHNIQQYARDVESERGRAIEAKKKDAYQTVPLINKKSSENFCFRFHWVNAVLCYAVVRSRYHLITGRCNILFSFQDVFNILVTLFICLSWVRHIRLRILSLCLSFSLCVCVALHFTSRR